MMTNSYLEYFLTLLAWVVNNGLWSVLTSTGLFALPLVFKVLEIWLKVREEGRMRVTKVHWQLCVSRTRFTAPLW